MRCAQREPGRSWEAIDAELARLGEPPAATLPAPPARRAGRLTPCQPPEEALPRRLSVVCLVWLAQAC